MLRMIYSLDLAFYVDSFSLLEIKYLSFVNSFFKLIININWNNTFLLFLLKRFLSALAGMLIISWGHFNGG